MESLKVHLQELYLVLEEPPDLVHTLLQSNYFLGNHSDILELKGIFECMEDPNIFATWFRNSKVCSPTFEFLTCSDIVLTWKIRTMIFLCIVSKNYIQGSSAYAVL